MVANSVVCLVLLIFSNFFVNIKGQYASDFPSPMPLVIKSPYFNFWMPSDSNLTTPGGRLPMFYTGSNASWSGYIRVDGTAYNFQGDNSNYTTTKTFRAFITPTRTIFTIDAGSVRLNLTYLSPIEPTDWKLQSFPFAYMAIDIWSTDSQPHHVQIYTDVSGQFVSSNANNTIAWNTTQTASRNSIYHRVQRISMESLTENGGMSEDGVLYFATQAATNLTWQTGAFYGAQSAFLANGTLNNSRSETFRQISDNTPVMSFALDLGNITSTADPVVFTLGLVRDPVLTYTRGGSVHNRRPLWLSKWSSIDIGIDSFLSNYSSALSRAVTLDTKIMSDAANISTLSSTTSPLYQNLVALNLRQTLGALEFTTSMLANGTLAGTSDLRVFMKDVGVSRRVNPVEVIYASLPAFLYLHSPLAGALLEPLLEFQITRSQSSRPFAAPDLGSSWPQVKGNTTDPSSLAVENCGSMLVMALAHARKSGDGWLIHRYYKDLETWADYLVTAGLQLNGSLASDNIPETSNLALKSIMGIYAMGNINHILEARGADPAKTRHYLDTATSYAKQWESLAFSSDHITSTYGSTASWGFMYNLYLPRLLGAGMFSQKIYDSQAAWYATKLAPTDSFGIGYDSNDPNTAKAHWTLLTAGSVYNTSASAGRDALIDKAEARPYFKNINNKPNPSTYAADFGTTYSGISSPALGASFAILALSVPDQSSITLPSETIMHSESPTRSNKRSQILGGTLGTLAGLILVGLVVFFFLRRRRRRARYNDEVEIEKSLQSPSVVEHSPVNPTSVAPFNSRSSKAQLLMMYDESAVSPSSDSGSRAAGEASASSPSESGSQQQQQQARLVPQRAALLHVTNRASGEGKPLPSPGTPKIQPEVRQTEGQGQGQDQNLRREVEQLRLEMEAIRAGQQQQPRTTEEPPPSYVEE